MKNDDPDGRAAIYDDLHHNQIREQEEQNRNSAGLILGELFRHYVPNSVLDVGCGVGTWLEVAQSLGCGDVLGIEGAWLDKNLARIPQQQIINLDLEQDFNLGRSFGMVISLEVAEHLHARSARTFIASLTRHADVILFSAAIPYQGGHHHVNEQFLDYWDKIFNQFGYRPVDCIRPLIWNNPSVLWWLRQNIIVFAKQALTIGDGPFSGLMEKAGPLSIVHPQIYVSRIQNAAFQAEQTYLGAAHRQSEQTPPLNRLTQPSSAADSLPVDFPLLFRLYAAGEYDKLSEEFLGVFEYFTANVYLNNNSIRAQLVPFLNTFFALFTQPDYVISDKYAIRFIIKNTLLANLTAMSPFRTTDAFLEIILPQPSNFYKILTLYSARNSMQIAGRLIFDADPEMASLWYNVFCESVQAGLVREDIVRHLTEHLSYRDERMNDGPGLDLPYFASTYVDGALDREVKPFLNKVARRHDHFQWVNRPNPNKIAVFSDKWLPGHSVYRNYAAFVKELKKTYHLTYFHILPEREVLDVSMFDEVYRLEMQDDKLRVDPLLFNDFQAVYFPDVGMTRPSILLANYRIAPIQFCSPGHSVSTWGSQIDYFISGADVEIAETPEINYSERLVLIPGMGLINNRPLHEPTGARKEVPEIVINCAWATHKIHYRFLRTLRKLVERSPQQVLLRIFPSSTISDFNAHRPFLDALSEALGQSVTLDIRPHLPYPDYMRLMEEGDLSLDSFHFSGCNTVIDSLYLRKPIVVWEGDKWYNRIGPAMLRLVGLDEFICTNEDEYLTKALLLIGSDQKRAEVTARLQAADLDATLFSTEHAAAFRRAVTYLIANHEELQKDVSSKAIVIS